MKTILGYMPQGTGTAFPFDAIFDTSVNALEHGVKGCDALVVWGGEDISASYYDHVTHPFTQNKGGPSRRDINEFAAMKAAKELGIPIIGVCRGAQALCVFSGGSLVQHTTGHHSTHSVATSDGDVMLTSSCHHQMMYPYNVDHVMLATSTEGRSTTYEGGNRQQIEMPNEPEVVYFPQTNGLAIQGHPEWMDENSEFVWYCLDMVRKHCLKETEIEV